jgi:hypothetical protein
MTAPPAVPTVCVAPGRLRLSEPRRLGQAWYSRYQDLACPYQSAVDAYRTVCRYVAGEQLWMQEFGDDFQALH